MATITFSSLSGTNNTLAFNPTTDILLFDSQSISAADVLVSTSFTAGTAFTYNGVSVTLGGIPGIALSSTNVVFANGSKFLVGDQTASTSADLANGFTFAGSAGADALYGFNGNDTFNGGDGNDRFFLASAPTSSADTVNGGSGDDRVIFVGINTSTGSIQGTTNNTNVNLGTGQATWGTSTVQLNSVEQVQVVAANNTTHIFSGGDGDETFIVGGTTGTTTASYTFNGGNGADFLAFNSFNTTSVTVSLMNTSTTWVSAQVSYSNVESLSGTAGNDSLTGNTGDNSFVGRSGDDVVSGDAGTDTAIFLLDRVNYTVAPTASGFTVQATSGTEGSDSLSNVERLQFANKKIALDLAPTENAGQALEFIGALAHGMVSTPSVVGSILTLFDQGYNMTSLSQLAIDVGLINQLAGSSSNADLARLVFRNVVGQEADANMVDSLVGYIDGRYANYSQAEFIATVAGLELNQQHINLVGLQSTGVEYII